MIDTNSQETERWIVKGKKKIKSIKTVKPKEEMNKNGSN